MNVIDAEQLLINWSDFKIINNISKRTEPAVYIGRQGGLHRVRLLNWAIVPCFDCFGRCASNFPLSAV